MKLYKKCLTMLLVGGLIFSLGACKEKVEEKPQQEQSAVETIGTAAQKLEEATSFTSKLTADVKMSSDENEVKATEEINTVFHIDPLSAYIVEKVNQGLNANDVMEKISYLQEKDGTATYYMSFDNQWSKVEGKTEELLAVMRSYNTKENLLSFLKEAQDLKEKKSKDVMILEGVLPASVVPAVVEETKALQFIGMADLNPQVYGGVKDLPILFRIDKETGYPVGYSFDLNDILQVVTDNAMELLGNTGEFAKIKVETCAIDVTIGDFNKAPKVEIPPEAFHAKLYNPDSVLPQDKTTPQTEQVPEVNSNQQ